MTIPTITPQELFGIMSSEEKVDLIDVRTPQEFAEVHARGARLAPLDELSAILIVWSRKSPEDRPLYFICRVGSRSHRACEQMIAEGISNVINVAGGTEAWIAAGLPTESGNP